MSAKTIFVIFGQVLLIQAVISQCIQQQQYFGGGVNSFVNGLSNIGVGPVGPYNNYVNLPMPGFPNQPIGISVSADNLVIDGFLDVAGNLPFSGVVVVEGAVPSDGQAEAYYGCGDGNVGITSSSVGVPQGPALGPMGMVPNFNAGGMVPNFNGLGLQGMNVNRFGGCN